MRPPHKVPGDKEHSRLAEGGARMPATILFFASNPKTTMQLVLDEEPRDIEAKIRAAEDSSLALGSTMGTVVPSLCRLRRRVPAVAARIRAPR